MSYEYWGIFNNRSGTVPELVAAVAVDGSPYTQRLRGWTKYGYVIKPISAKDYGKFNATSSEQRTPVPGP